MNIKKGTHSDPNNASIVLKVTITNEEQRTHTSALLGADAEFASWANIMLEHQWRMKAELLKVSHHGSNFGSYKDVLQAISPQYSVVTGGPNLYGHPDRSALEFIGEATSIRVFRTDRDGTCVFESDGMQWRHIP